MLGLASFEPHTLDLQSQVSEGGRARSARYRLMTSAWGEGAQAPGGKSFAVALFEALKAPRLICEVFRGLRTEGLPKFP